MSCLFIRNNAEPGLSSFSAMSLGFAADLDEAFFDFAFDVAFSDSDLEAERLRGGFLKGTSPLDVAVSLRGTFVTVVRGSKKSLVTPEGSRPTVWGWYCSIALSVIVLTFFLGALPFSGDEFRELEWLPGRSMSYEWLAE